MGGGDFDIGGMRLIVAPVFNGQVLAGHGWCEMNPPEDTKKNITSK